MPVRSRADTRLLAKVSQLYYLQNLTQQQIADRLRLSRPGVSRLLETARQQGIVQISVVTDDGAAGDLEGALEKRFGLREAVVTASGPDGGAPGGRLGAAAAEYLHRTMAPGTTVGLSWGTTLHEMVRAVRPEVYDGSTVVQMLGGVGPVQHDAHATDLARRLAVLLGAELRLIQAPGIVATSAVRRALLEDPQIHRVVDAVADVDVAFVGVGALSTNPLLAPGAGGGVVPDGLGGRLAAAGAVGDVALRFFDAAGAPVPSPLDDRIVGVALAALAALPHVVGVAGGAGKAEAIRAALRAGLLDVLITDADTAAAVLDDGGPDGP